MELLKLLSTNEIVAQVLSFLILLFLLRIFAWKKILGLLDQRKERIVSEFKKIDDAQLEIAALRAEYEKKLSAIEEAANAKIEEAVSEGKLITQKMRNQAYAESQEIINNARESIKLELSKAKDELKKNIIDLTIKATENLLAEKLTAEKDKKLVQGFLEKVDSIP